MPRQRLFIALDAPDDVRDALAALRTDLDGARWTRPEQYHLTLRFVGDAGADRAAALQEALAGVAAAPVDIRLEGFGVFPRRRRPRVLVARAEASAALVRLQERVEAAVQAAGFGAADRPFRPHVTLARFKRADARAVQAYVRAHTLEAAFTAEAFHLYESILGPSGALHARRATYILRGA